MSERERERERKYNLSLDTLLAHHAGTRFGPQGIRRISALYSPYNYEMGVDLREQMTLCDAGDVFTIPGNIEKTFDQISNAVAHVCSTGAFPVILGGDHSIGFPTIRGLASVTSKRIGIIHFDRHADIQETVCCCCLDDPPTPGVRYCCSHAAHAPPGRPRRRTSMSACIRRLTFTRPTSPTSALRTSCKSASAAGK